MTKTPPSLEHHRLQEIAEGVPWRKWGCYLSERQWGTVREDYSADGSAWESFPHDQARGRAYRWGEDGIAGLCDDKQILCFSLALWNGKDPILKERLFGLTGNQGNHGEDVKECYYYLDNTPTHSWMRMLYKYPQAAYPYEELLEETYRRSKKDAEFELMDTGVFDFDRYFDVFVEYAKGGPEDILVRITAINRGPEAASLHVIPQLWFRNTWSWYKKGSRPRISMDGRWRIHAEHPVFGSYYLSGRAGSRAIFTENDTNPVFIGLPETPGYFKDGFHRHLVEKKKNAVNPAGEGTKAAFVTEATIAPGESAVFEYCLSSERRRSPFVHFDETIAARREEADAFYETIHGRLDDAEMRMIQRQSLAGMLWSKQYYGLDIRRWLAGDETQPAPPENRKHGRNSRWSHLSNNDVISMPDKWEYPWYAAWDLAFHTLPLAIVDPDFAKDQMTLMLKAVYLHPSGQLPAYEWNFSDVNPPVHAWATLFLHRTSQGLGAEPDLEFIKVAFNKLMLNFTWWANRKDRFGKNVFEGGFLGLDNIGVFDRSSPLPTGGYLEQADGTAWMALFSQNMMELAVELTAHDPTYEDMVLKFAEQFYYISAALNRSGQEGMWDEEDGFYYDVLRLPDGSATRLKVRSLVGLLPLCATTVTEPWQREQVPRALAGLRERLRRIPELGVTMHPIGPEHYGENNRGLFAVLNPERLRRVLTRMLDENEFFGPHGIRSISKFHEQHPYVFHVQGQEYRVDYLPAESNTGMFGGNSNWRGPVWMPVNAMIIRALLNYYMYYGDRFKIECPTGSGKMMNLFEVSKELSDRLCRTFLRDEHGRRPVHGGTEKFQSDPHWKDLILFYEYFHADNGAGLGASHQTGWTGLVAKFIQMYGSLDARRVLEGGKMAGFKK